ncbi:transcriptional regulator [Scytonema hofmannii PCC 7110]|uniref:Transcriptional regulator n=1 Tax=Scytonema hofmannii PCC 7110 TaxID=128403 RepID=A0A139WUF7_9CYAN|nr:ATP-binding protein [Scytonema hofmannii]KYC36049.1 transcriptional regulator [Scytonema hofmannii PCC 7110]
MLTFDELWEFLTIQDESTEIEAKKASEVGKSCWETISAFANEPGLGGGYLLLGIKSPQDSNNNEYEIEGIINPDKIQTDLSSQCSEVFNIPIRPYIELAIKDGKTIIVAFIPEAQPSEKPIYIKNQGLPKGAYRRISSTDQRCTEKDIERFYQERSYQTYDTTPIPDATFDDLDPEAIAAYRRERQAVNSNASELGYEDRKLLFALNVLTKHPTQKGEYCPTIAGLILFGNAIALRRYFPMHRIDYILVEGKEWVSDLDKRYQSIEIREPLLLAIPKLITLVLNDLPKAFNLAENDIHRRETPLIPRKVIREAIVNALMHRNYREWSPVQIIRFSDRLEIRNPGYSLKPTDEFDQPGSKTRNEKIAAVLHEVNIAETKGSGGRVMLEKMLEANLTLPLFVSNRDRDYFHVTLFTHHLLDGDDIEWLKQFKNYALSNDEVKALVLLSQVKIINNFIYRFTNDVDTLTASQHLRRLRDAGLLLQQGKGSATCYILSPEFQSKDESEVDKSNLDSSTPDRKSLSRQLENPNLDSSTPARESLSGQLENSNLDSSTPARESLSGQLENSNLDSSTPARESLSGQLENSNLDSSTLTPEQLTLELFTPNKKDSLEERLTKIGKRNEPEEIKSLILELCELKSRASSELESLLKRNRKYLLDQYLKPLIDEGLLEYTNPEKPNAPHQTYRTIQK